MATEVLMDPIELAKLVRHLAKTQENNKDEVWDGVYVVAPGPNNEHRAIVGGLNTIFDVTLGWTGLGLVRPGANVSDREVDWEQNFRCPDVVVYLNGTTARDMGAFWLGGPDFAVEVVSKGDRCRKKFDFYGKVGTRELLIVDRFPWVLELYRLQDGAYMLGGRSSLDRPEILFGEVLSLNFRLMVGDPRPKIEVVHADGVQRWSV